MSFSTIARASLLLVVACSSEQGGDVRREYAPCNGEPGACGEAVRMGGAVDGCVCTYYCKSDADCPKPGSGTVTPHCEPFGDVVINGHTAACVLPCGADDTCPDGMFCSGTACWGRIVVTTGETRAARATLASGSDDRGLQED